MTKSRKMRPHLESLGARTLPAAGPLGIDVGTPEYVDMIKQSNGFFGPVDSRGWPAADDSIVVFDDRVNEPWNGPDPNASQADMSGTYHLSFQGQSSVSASWPVTIQNAVYNASTNITTADVVNPVGNLFLQLNFSNTVRNPGGASDTGITNVRLIRPGYATDTSQEFTNQYIAALEPFNTIRTLDATNANSYGPEWAGVPLNWSQRHLPTDATTASDSDGRVGATSWEDLIALANAAHTNLWINIPGPATDDYITQLANLIKNGDTVDGIRYSGLDPSLKVYVEWSNEVWGGIAATYNYNVADMDQQLQQGNSILTADGTVPSTSTWISPILLRNDLLHIKAIATDFNAVFNDPNHNRIRPIMAWQGGNLWADSATFAWFQSNFGAPSQYLYGMGGTNYYSPSDYSSVDNLLSSLSAAEQALNLELQQTTAIASQWGLKNVAYEGGPGISNTGAAGQVGLAALRDPRMEQIVYQGYIDWYADGGDLANFYGPPYGIWGPQWPWSAAELGQANDPSASPKYAGLMDVINASGPGAQANAEFLGTDTTTGGHWRSAYGSDGFDLAQDHSSNNPSLPSYAQVSISGQNNWTWPSGQTGLVPLDNAAGTGTILACWYAPSSMDFHVDLTDGQTHQVALYSTDPGSTERFEVLDAGTDQVLDTQTVAGSVGQYIAWNLEGNVTIQVTNLGPDVNANINAIFFGAAASAPTAQASFVGTDTTTGGHWRSAYGSDGFDLAQDHSSNNPSLPSYAQVSISGQNNWTWPSGQTGLVPLDNAAGTGTILACWYAPSSMDFHVDLTDGQTHRVALYSTDPGSTERFDVLDAGTGQVLDTQTVTGSVGQYIAWNLEGNVTIQVTNLGPDVNANINAIFFGAAASAPKTQASFVGTDTTTGGD